LRGLRFELGRGAGAVISGGRRNLLAGCSFGRLGGNGVGHRIAHNLFHDSPQHAMRVEGYEHTIELNEIHSVVYESVNCGRFTIRDRGVNELMDNHAFYGDPGFADPDRRDFALDEDSPVYDRFGFRPIPFREIGLYESETRATWPVEHTITPHYVPE
jgi:hypothetical protein